MAARNALDSPDSYTLAWIAALPIERAAAEAMLDEEHAAPTRFYRHESDANAYTWGRIGEHNIVIVSLAAGVCGIAPAATTASSLLASLPSIRVGLFVGIGGGIAKPDEGYDIRLGDVVVSQPDGTTGGVCQYDLIKAKSGGKRERKGFLGRPPTVLLNALAKIQAAHERDDSKVPSYLQTMVEKNPKMGKRSKQNPGYTHQGSENDRLFKSSCDHIPGPDCRGCDTADEITRDPRDSPDPEIHYGIIASGNTLFKDAAERDRIVADVGEDCICFEMEAAGLMNHFPCLVIRGICDYADSHKNDRWQRYASATAAAYAKELLGYVPASEVQESERALKILNSIQQQIDGVQQTTAATKAATNFIISDLCTGKIRHWLRPSDPSTNAIAARESRHKGTGAWLLDSPVFREWHWGSRRHLWLNGLAGCGKTVLSTTVLDHLMMADNSLVLSFFFDFSDITKQTLDNMLRSIAFQLYQSRSGSEGILVESFQTHQEGGKEPATKTLEDIVCRMLLAVPNKSFVVLDALDESTTRGELLTWVKDIVSRPGLETKLICTGRPEPEFIRDIPALISEESCLVLDKNSINSDIRSYVSAQLSERRDFREKSLSEDLLEKIRRRVGDGADGMFRWAACQLASLAKCPHQAALERALTSLPRDLYETYRRMIQSIPEELKDDATRLLQFLVHSPPPLKLAEAKEIIATQIEHGQRGFDVKRRLFCETDVFAYCHGLVRVVHATSDELHLAHFSVKEYLLGEIQFAITPASISMTMTCLTYLADMNDKYDLLEKSFPMAHYAAKLWTKHAVFAQASQDVVQTVVKFLEEETTFKRWQNLQQHDHDFHFGTQSSALYYGFPPLFYASLFGLVAPARYFINKGAKINTQEFDYSNALYAAIKGGHQEIVQMLLDNGADVNAYGRFNYPLYTASEEGHQEIVQMLLKNRADLNAQSPGFSNALGAAIKGGHQEIVQMLLDNGADVNAYGSFNYPLYTASEEGHQRIVQMLKKNRADVNAQYRGYSNALCAAIKGGHQEIVQMLLDNGADVNAYGSFNYPLYTASEEGHQRIVQMLKKNRADLNAQCRGYSNALAAFKRRHQEIVQMLLDNGAKDLSEAAERYYNAQ